MKFSAMNSKTLCLQVNRFNRLHPSASLSVNWGREGKIGTWFAHGAYGADLKTLLTFDEVVAYVQDQADAALDVAAWNAREEAIP